MDAKLMIDLAQRSIAEVFSQVITDTKFVLIIKSKVDRSLSATKQKAFKL